MHIVSKNFLLILKKLEMMSQSQPHLMGWCVQSLFISGEDGAQVWGNRLLAHPSLKHPVSTFPPVNKDNYRANELRKKGLSDWYSQWGN